jgi:hypothetical protein
LQKKISTDIDEFFLPRDFGQFCIGCANCIKKSETLCPHYTNLLPVTKSIDEADLTYWKRKGWDKKERPWK